MTEIDALKYELEENRKSFDTLHKKYVELLKQQGRLEKENEQLKTTIQQLRTDNTKQKKLLNTTMKENEHIKQTIQDMINTERTEIRQSVLRQLWEAIQ